MENVEKLPEKKKRAPRSRPTDMRHQRYNDKCSWKELERVMADNFGQGDLLVTLTYSEIWLPHNKAAAREYIRSFLRKLRNVRRQQGDELLFVYTTEGLHRGCADDRFGRDSALEDQRIHHHAVINGGDIEKMRDLWEYGDLRADLLEVNRYQELARYFTKEAREEGRKKLGERAWCCSRNLRRNKIGFSPEDEK